VSKSAADPKLCILLTDPYKSNVKLIRITETDSIPRITFSPVKHPGTSNLLTILSTCSSKWQQSLQSNKPGVTTMHQHALVHGTAPHAAPHNLHGACPNACGASDGKVQFSLVQQPFLLNPKLN
jgi:hypothetical protein